MELLTLTVLGIDGDAGGTLHHLGDTIEPEVFHLFAGDHGDRLWRFAWRQHHAGRGVGRVGGVAAGTFGSHARVVVVDGRPDHINGVQRMGVITTVPVRVKIRTAGQNQTGGEPGKT